MENKLQHISDQDLINLDIEKVKDQYGSLYWSVLEILKGHNPINAPFFGEQEDEYAPEAKTIVGHFQQITNESEMIDFIHEVFIRWFAEDIAGPRDRYKLIAQDLLKLNHV